jgi:hypothetical protein
MFWDMIPCSLRLKNTLTVRTLTYASETSTLTKRDRKEISIFLKGKRIEEFLAQYLKTKKRIGGY